MSQWGDVSELNTLAADLSRAGKVDGRALYGVMSKGALNIKNEAAQMISGLAHAPHYPRSISYDIEVGGNSIEAVIGPDKGRMQGALGNILEYGTVNNPPHSHLGPALDREGPRFEDALTDVIGEVLW